jgi:hypothetical protein
MSSAAPVQNYPPEQHAAHTERDLLKLLHHRYSKIAHGARRYAVAEHVPDRPYDPRRIADFIAVDCWRGPVVPGKSWVWGNDEWGYPVHGHEVKVSRSDWLTELKNPDKADAFRRYCDYWWLVVPDRAIVHDGELPAGWGLLAVRGGQLRAAVAARRQDAVSMTRAMNTALVRAIAKTAARAS